MSAEETPILGSRSRRTAREVALKALYGIWIGHANPDEAIANALVETPLAPENEAFMRSLVAGVGEHRGELDGRVAAHLSAQWNIERIAVTDRLALWLAGFELWYLPGMPPKVTIVESASLADRFGTPDSARFVQGVMAKLLAESPKANWDRSQEEVPQFEPAEEPEAETPTEEVAEGSEEHGEILKAGPWVIRHNEPEGEPKDEPEG